MNRSCFLSRATRRTPPNPWDTRSPLGVGRVLDSTEFSWIDALPSTPSAEACASLFGGFMGTMASCDSSGACMSGLWLLAFPDRSPNVRGRPRGLPVLVHIVSRRARGLRLRRVRRAARELAPPADVAFPQSGPGRHPNLSFRSSIPCPPVPLSTLRLPPRDDRRKTRGQDGIAFPFL